MEDLFKKTHGVYIRIDDSHQVIDINSDEFISSDMSGWIKIDEGYGDKYHHAQGNYLGKPIKDFFGAYNYKFVDDVIVERSSEEINRDRLALASKKIPDSELALIELAGIIAEQQEAIIELANLIAKEVKENG